MNINSMLEIASTKQTAAKPSKGNSKTSDTLFQSILGQKSQGRDNSTAAVQDKTGPANSNKSQTQTSKSDKPADISSDNSSKDVDNSTQNEGLDRAGSSEKTPDTETAEAAQPEDVAQAEDTTATAEADETTEVVDKDTTDEEQEVLQTVSSSTPFIFMPGPITATEAPKPQGTMEMVSAQPVFQTTEVPERIQAPVAEGQPVLTQDIETVQVSENAPEFVMPELDVKPDANAVKVTTAMPEMQISTDADAPEVMQAALELDPELTAKVETLQGPAEQKPTATVRQVETVTAEPQNVQNAELPQEVQPGTAENVVRSVTEDTVQQAKDGHVDHAEQFAAQVVKEAKNLVDKNSAEEQAPVPAGEEVTAVREDAGTARPIEASEEGAFLQDNATDGDEQQETTNRKDAQVNHTMGTAAPQDGGRVDFRTLGAQPLEAQPAAAPPEPPQVILNKVVDQVRSVVTPDKTEFFVQLKPDHLGGLSIGLVAEDKGVVAKIMTSSQQVHSALQADLNQMVQMLRDRGINVVQMEVIYDQTANAMSHQQGDNQQQQFNHGHGRSHHGRGAEQVDGAVSMYDTLSSYEVLAEQGGSVEFSA